MQDLVRNSYEKNYSRELRGAFGQDTSVSQYAEGCGSENVVRVVLVNPNFEASLTKAVEELSAAKLRLDKFGFSSSGGTSQQCSLSTLDSLQIEQPILSDKLTVLINAIKIAMKNLQYASYRGKIYKKDKWIGPGLPFLRNASHGRLWIRWHQTNFSNPDFWEIWKRTSSFSEIPTAS